MADYCPKCGATHTGHYPVCAICGAALGDAASLPPIAPWIPTLSKAKTPASITVAALAALVALGIAFGVWRASRVPDQDAAAAPTPQAKAASVSADGLGVDIYPGARQQQRTVRTTPSGATLTAVLTTSDSLDKVLDFYLTRLGSRALVSQTSQSVVFAASRIDRRTSVMLTISAETGGQTRIGILHSTTR